MSARWIRKTQYDMRSAINRSPAMFALLSRMQPQYGSVVVSPDTDIIIEGFPRSGNTFAVVSLQLAGKGLLRIARHTHAPAQIALGAREAKPTLVLIRDPIDAAVSLLIREPALSSRQVLRSYIRFYSKTASYRGAVVVATFAQATSGLSEPVAKLNSKFGTAFAALESSEENTRRCFDAIEQMESQESGEPLRETHVARPSPYREAIKDSMRPRVMREKRLLARAYDVFDEFSQLAEGNR